LQGSWGQSPQAAGGKKIRRIKMADIKNIINDVKDKAEKVIKDLPGDSIKDKAENLTEKLPEEIKDKADKIVSKLPDNS
jgi:hypothetical protein